MDERGGCQSPANPQSPGGVDEVVAFLRDRSAPCPRCGYELRALERATCPECGEPLILKVGSPRTHFGWLVVAMAPGCFSGVAAVFVMVPIIMSTLQGSVGSKRGVPLPVLGAEVFGILSACAVVLLYRERHRIMRWPTRRQAGLAAGVWGTHVLAFVLMLLALWLFY